VTTGISLRASMAALFGCLAAALLLGLRQWRHGYLHFLKGRMRRLLAAPFYHVRFPDFFLGDQLTSHTYLLQQLVLLACTGAEDCRGCRESDTTQWAALSITLVPYWLRLTQCFRRLRDEWYQRRQKGFLEKWAHALNAGKYSASLVAVAAKMAKHHYDDSDAAENVFIVVAAIAATYSCAWDFYMDWGLLRPNAAHPMLRDKLQLSQPWIYFASMALNLVLRVLWIGTLVPAVRLDDHHPEMYPFMLALLEVLRRCHWNFYRVENEHLNNCGNFRATHHIPLPFAPSEHDD